MNRTVALTIAFALPAIGFAACGGRSGLDADGSAGSADASIDALYRGDVLLTPQCGEVSLIPSGYAFVGAWEFVTTARTFVRPPPPCGVYDPKIQDIPPGNRRLLVPEYGLMTLPVTNRCYRECVNRGDCAAPVHDPNDPDARTWLDDARALEPVSADHDRAETFCKWLGGRLPTLAEIVRAAQGDAETPGVANMTRATIDCIDHPNPNSQICSQIRQMDFMFDRRPSLYPVATVDQDQGPFGNRDLFGSVLEWTQTFVTFDSKDFCALADGAVDFKTFERPEPCPTCPQHSVLQFASMVLGAIRDIPHEVESGNGWDLTVSYQIGFRCAF